MRNVLLASLLAFALAGCGSSSGTVPTLAPGSSLEDAYQLLHGEGFRVGVRFATARSIPDSFLQVAAARSLSPPAGTNVGSGGVVTVIASTGLPGSPAGKTVAYRHLPNFVGKPAQSAVTWANAHSVLWAIPKLPALPPSSAPLLLDGYRIVAQEPAAGALLAAGRPLRLTVRPA